MTPKISPTFIHVRYHWLLKVVVWASLIVTVTFAVNLLPARVLDATILLVGAVVLGGLTVAGMTYFSIETDSEAVNVKGLLRHFRIPWDEVQLVELNNQGLGQTLVFHGQNKWLVVATIFTNADQQRFHDYIEQQIQQRQIRVKYSSGLPLFNKNTQVGTRLFK